MKFVGTLKLVLLCTVIAQISMSGMAILDENSWNPSGISNIGDPAVLKEGSTYYLYTTSSFFQSAADFGIRSWTSTDLRNWQAPTWVFTKSDTTWGQQAFWAPETIKGIDGKFYMFYTASAAGNVRLSICIAQSDSPSGPFTEFRAPFITLAIHDWDPMIFRDTDGRYYLYWSRWGEGILGQEISADFTTLIGNATTVVHPTPQAWHGGTEAAYLIKLGATYYMMYSGNGYTDPNYAVGYATSSTPLGLFSKYAANPILSKDMTPGARISGPGTNAVTTAPDGKLKIVYNAHSDPDKPNGDRTLYVDDLNIGPQGELYVTPTRRAEADDTLTSGIEPGWASLGFNVPGFAWPSFDDQRGHYLGHVAADPSGRYRAAGLITSRPNWLPYSSVGSENYVRAKFYIYTGGQQNPNDPAQYPTLRLRVSNRFSVSAMLELMHHQNIDPGNHQMGAELRPSTNPDKPSVYRIDFDPVDVPYLSTSTTNEGVFHGFEAMVFDPEENGYVAMAESQIEAYPKALLPDSNEPSVLKQVFAPTAVDAGSLHLSHPASMFTNVNLLNPTYIGDPGQDDPTDSPKGVHTEGPFGVTLDSTNVEEYAVAFMQRDFYPGADLAARSRVAPGKQYKIRFHVTSTQQTNRQGWIALRARSVKFGWVYQLLMTGAFTTNGLPNQMITQQSIPGIGSLNPDKIGNENGGWYTVHMHTPLSPDIRTELDDSATIEQEMPLLSAEPGPGENLASRREIRPGFYLMDSPGVGENQKLEKANFTVDRVEVREYDLLPD